MRSLLIATTNPGKYSQLRDALLPLNLDIHSLLDFAISTDEVPEVGSSARDNARMKAGFYTKAFNIPTLSMDNGLLIDGLKDEDQPGVFVRRIYGPGDYSRPTDKELLAYYAGLVKGVGGVTIGRWIYAFALALDTSHILEAEMVQPRQFVCQPCQNIITGYPLESLQVDPDSGKYIAEMEPVEKQVFWQNLIGPGLVKLVMQGFSILDSSDLQA